MRFLESVSVHPAYGNPRTGLLRTFWKPDRVQGFMCSGCPQLPYSKSVSAGFLEARSGVCVSRVPKIALRVSLGNFILAFENFFVAWKIWEFPTIRALAVWTLANFNLAWKFQSRRGTFEFFNLWGPNSENIKVNKEVGFLRLSGGAPKSTLNGTFALLLCKKNAVLRAFGCSFWNWRKSHFLRTLNAFALWALRHRIERHNFQPWRPFPR